MKNVSVKEVFTHIVISILRLSDPLLIQDLSATLNDVIA
jgi:hypothetical protein